MTGLVSCPLWKSWQAGWDRQQDTRVLESHRRLEGRSVPQHTEIISEAFTVLSYLYHETVRKINTT